MATSKKKAVKRKAAKAKPAKRVSAKARRAPGRTAKSAAKRGAVARKPKAGARKPPIRKISTRKTPTPAAAAQAGVLLLAKTQLTGSQTVGPFFRFGLIRTELETVWTEGALGQRIRVVGRVTDGAGAPVPDAMIEIWQADADGHYAHPADQRAGKRDHVFRGFGRASTNVDGLFHFDTIKPGPVPGTGNATQAPHLEVSVFARGLLDRLITRLYFPDEPLNEQDPLLASIRDAAVRDTLIARRDGREGGLDMPTYVFDIRLQGEGETAFFDA